MTYRLHRAGSADGLMAVSVSDAVKAGLLLGWTTAVSSVRDPAHRPIGMMWALLTVVAGGFGGVFNGTRGAVAGAAAGFVGYAIVIMLMSVIIEPVLFRCADRVWLISGSGRRGCAKAVVRGDGSWRLSSVAAWPFGRGIGTELTRAVVTDADRCQRTLELTAENRRVGSLYERFGFVYPRPGRREMHRSPVIGQAQPHLSSDGDGSP